MTHSGPRPGSAASRLIAWPLARADASARSAIPSVPDSSDGPVLKPPPPIRISGGTDPSGLPNEVEMPLMDHLEELRQRVLRSLLAVVVSALVCLLAVKPLVRLLEAPAQGIHFLQLAPGEFLFVSL